MKVIKKSGKPFKSGNKINTVNDIIDHPILLGKKAYTFLEDDSYVRIDVCTQVDDDGIEILSHENFEQYCIENAKTLEEWYKIHRS